MAFFLSCLALDVLQVMLLRCDLSCIVYRVAKLEPCSESCATKTDFLQDEAKKMPQHSALPAPDFPTVTEREKFDLKTTEPLKLRPFKPKYHLTMGKHAHPNG